MPCDTIQRSSVSLELNAENKEFLKAALESLDYSVIERGETLYFSQRFGNLSGNFENGRLNLTGDRRLVDNFDTNAVKRAYSRQVVNEAKKRFGWSMTEKAPNKFAVQKRGLR